MIKNHKRLLIAATMLFVVCVAVLITIDKKLTGSTTAVVVSSPYPITKLSTLNLIPKNYLDNLVSFNYPAIMSVNQPPKFSSPIIDIVSLAYPDIQGWLLTVQVLAIPSGNLYDNSSFQARIVAPATYQLTQTNINGTSVPAFNDKTSSSYNVVSFLISGGYQATVSLTGNDPSGLTPLASTMAMILDSWQWQGAY